MKTLIYAMQSSGASLYAWYLAQKKDVIGIVDLNNHRLAPPITAESDIVLKCVITTRWTLEQHVESFKPDKTILYLRDPYQTYSSLVTKVYANKSGTIDEKFRILDQIYQQRDNFDEVVLYEEFIQKHRDFVFVRSKEEIIRFNESNSEWCKLNPEAPGDKGGSGFGGICGKTIQNKNEAPIENEIIFNKVKNLCPELFQLYHQDEET